MRIIYANFFSPLVITLLFVQELTGAIVVETLGIEQSTWEVLRLGVVIAFMVLRYLSLREELQLQFDQSYVIISRMMIEKDERTFHYVQLRVEQNFREIWFTVLQHASNFMLPILLCICFMQRTITFQLSESDSFAFNFTSTIEKHQEAMKALETYDLLSDREQL